MSPFFKSILSVCSLLILSGCTIDKPALHPAHSIPSETTVSKESVQPSDTKISKPPQSVQPAEVQPHMSPRAIASLELSKQAQLLIEANKPDEAIRILERAVNLHPSGGENYYYLARAWLMKGNLSQASEYNTLAAMHLN